MIYALAFQAYVLRANMSINILGMVVDTTANDSNLVENTGDRYTWTEEEQGWVQGAYFWGVVMSQIPGGMLCEKYGGHLVIAYGLGLSGSITLLLPLSADISVWAVFAVRWLTGLFSGVMSPGNQFIISKWAPPDEKGKFISTLIGGATLGVMLTWPISGYVTETIGWRTAFYGSAVMTLLMTVAWLLFVTDSPAEHRMISSKERAYIESCLGNTVSSQKEKPAAPIKKILFSPPFWSLVFLQFGHRWALYFMLNSAPKYMKQVLHFKLTKSGILASLPYMCQFVTSFGFAALGDAIRARKIMSVTAIRKGFCLSSHIIPGLLLLSLTYVGTNATTCITLMTLSLAFNGAATLTNLQNFQDLAPNYAATIYSMVNCISSMTGFISPMVVAYFTKEHNTMEQWNKVFYISSALYITSAIVFIIFGSGNIQEWNYITKSPELQSHVPSVSKQDQDAEKPSPPANE